MNLFSHCVLTASNKRQADAFLALIDRRVEHGLYPREISFHVYADPPGRVGSGGGTMWALSQLFEEIGYHPAETHSDAPTVLLIHGAGESRRLPIYAPEAKLFAPAAVPSSSIIPPVALDVQLPLYLSFPWEPGMVVVCAGDAIIDFDAQAIGRLSAPITGFAAPASLEQGSRHGVFVFDPAGRAVKDYLQKTPVTELEQSARIEGTEECALDIGIVAMKRDYVASFMATTDQGPFPLFERLRRGELRFELYLEQLLASLPNLGLNEYLARLDHTSALSDRDLTSLHKNLHHLELSAVLTRECTFIHFGSLFEYPEACHKLRQTAIRPFYSSFDTDEINPHLHNGVLALNSSEIGVSGRDCSFVERCRNSSDVRVGEHAVLTGLTGHNSPLEIPDGFALDVRKLDSGIAPIFIHRSDSFRLEPDLSLLVFWGKPLLQWLEQHGLTEVDIGADSSDAEVDLLRLKLFPVLPSTADLAWFIAPPTDPDAWGERFRELSRVSISELNELADPVERDVERTTLRIASLAKQIETGSGWRTLPEHDFSYIIDRLDRTRLDTVQSTTQDPLLRQYRAELLSCADEHGASTRTTAGALRFVSEHRRTLSGRNVKEDQIVWARSPVRLDLAGGWTDTPPYTNLFGGAVCNIAVDLNGQPPIQVFVRPRTDDTVVFHSIDLGERERIEDSTALKRYDNPEARFALPRAACVLLGLADGDNLSATLRSLGGGFELSILAAVPKGSGLGTSSILGGVILAALFRYFGVSYVPRDLFLSVLELEQMLTTGGGWQDQIGGLSGGVKYIETHPGMKPEPAIHQLDPWLFQQREYSDRMVLYYTGVTRLAKNILQLVVDRVNQRDHSYLFTHKHLKALARDARDAISLRDYHRIARVIARSWGANKLIHESTTNEEIERLWSATHHFWIGAKLLGAGGGGYALFLSPDRRAADALRETLAVYPDGHGAARLVDFAISSSGLQVSLS